MNLRNALLGLLLIIGCATLAPAATVTWSGAAANGLWSDPGNWAGSVLPGLGDDVVFDASAGVIPPVILLDGNRNLAFNSIEFKGGGSMVFGAAGTQNTITLASVANNVKVASGTAVTMNALVVGATPINVSGGGTILLDNYYSQAGNVSSDGAGTTVRFIHRNPSSSTIASMSATRGDIPAAGQVGGAVETLTGTNGGGFGLIGGYNPDGSTKVVSLGTGGATLNVAAGSTWNMDDASQISGSGLLTKTGNGRLSFATQDYGLTGGSLLNGGFLDVRSNGATGTFAGTATHVINGGVFLINGEFNHGGMTLNAGGTLGTSGADRAYGAAAGTSILTLNGGNLLVSDANTGAGLTPRINSPIQGSGTVNLVTAGPSRTAMVFQRFLSGTTTFNGRFIVGDNVAIENNPRNSGNVGQAIGAATVELAGFNSLLDLRDNGAGPNGTLAYGNNVEVTNALKGSIQGISTTWATANAGNGFALGKLTLGANRILQVSGANNTGTSFGETSFGGDVTFLIGANGTNAAGAADTLTFRDNATFNVAEGIDGARFTRFGRDTSATDDARMNVEDTLAFSIVNLVEGTNALRGVNGQIGVGAISGTGTLNLSTSSRLLLDDTAAVAAGQRIGALVSTVMHGGTISLVSNAAAALADQTIGSLNVANGQANMDSTRSNAAGLSVLTIGSAGNTAFFTRSANSTVNFTGTSLGTAGNTARIVLTSQVATSFLGGWAFSGSEFVKYSDTLNSGYALGVTPLLAGDYTLNPVESGYLTGLHVKASNATATTVTLLGNRAMNSLNLQGAGITTLALGTNQMVIESGGLLSSGAAHVISGGGTSSLTAGTTASASPLYATVTANSLDIGARITDNAAGGAVSLVKSGSGTLRLATPAVANTYTGGTFVNAGSLDVFSPGSLGSGALTLSGGNVNLQSNNAASNSTVNWTGTNIIVTANGSGLVGDNNTPAANGSNTNQLINLGSLTMNAPFSGGGTTLQLSGWDNVDLAFNGVSLANQPTFDLLSGKDANHFTRLNGVISGSSGFNVTGAASNSAGYLEIGGGTGDTSANTYTGEVLMLGGPMVLNKAATAITGDLILNGTNALLTFKNNVALSTPFAPTSRVFLLNGTIGQVANNLGVAPRDFIGVIPELIMKGGTLNSGWNSLTINKATISGGSITVNGTYNLGGTLTLNDTVLQRGAPNINIQAGAGADISVLTLGGTTGFESNGQNIVLNQATAITTAGSLVNLAGDIKVNADPMFYASYVSGMRIDTTATNIFEADARLDLQGGTRTFDIGSGATYIIQPNIVNGGITKTGNGILVLSSYLNSSTYTGDVAINGGVLTARNNSSLGTSLGGTTVAAGATLEFESGVTNAENITIAGFGSSLNGRDVAVRSLTGSTRLGGQITLAGDAAIGGWNHLVIPEAGFPAMTGVINLSFSSDLKLGGAVSGAGSLFLRGDANGTISGAMSQSGGLIKEGAGTWTLSGANSYAGSTLVAGGVLSARHSSALGSTTGGTRVTGGASLELAGNIAIGTESLTLHGTGNATRRGALVNASGSNSIAGGITLFTDPTGGQNTSVAISSMEGTLTISGDVARAAAAKGDLIVEGAGNVDITGNLDTTGTLTKSGTGTLSLNSSGLGTVDTVTLAGGTLSINTASNKIADTAALNLAGGSLVLTGSGNETVAALNLLAGGAEITLGAATLTSTSILTRSTGASLNFTGPGTLSVGLSNTNGIIGGHATLGRSDWATVSGSTAGALSTYVTVTENLGAPALVTPPLAADNVLFSSTQQTATTTALSVNSIKFGGTVQGIGQSGLNLATSSGGILYDGTVGSALGLAGTGTLSQGSGGEMFFHVNKGTLDAGMLIAGTNGLTKDGDGTLVLSGANTFTGNIFVNEGKLAIVGPGGTSDPTTLGATGARTLTLNGGTLSLLAGSYDPGAGTKAVAIGANGGTIEVASGEGQSGLGWGTLTLNDSAQFSGTGTLTKTGGGRLILGAQSYAFTGDIDIQGGVLEIQGTNSQAIGGVQPQQIINIGSGSRFDNSTGDLFANIIVRDGGVLGSRNNGTHVLHGTTTFLGNSTLTLLNLNNLDQSENVMLEGKVTLDAGSTLNVVGRANGNPLVFANAANAISGTIKLGANALLVANHAGTLGSDSTARAAIEMDANARLRIYEDTTADFLANVKITGTNALFDTRSSVVAGTGHILSLGSLEVTGKNQWISQIGAQSFGLRFSGAATIASTADTDIAYLDAQTGLVFDGGLTVSGGGIFAKQGSGQLQLRAANTFTGAYQNHAGDTHLRQGGTLDGITSLVVKGGRIVIDNTEGILANRVPDTASLSLIGGALYGSNNETLGATTLSGYMSQIRQAATDTVSGPQALTFASWTRQTGGSANFSAEGGGTLGAAGANPRIVITGFTNESFSGFMGGAYTVGGDWAQHITTVDGGIQRGVNVMNTYTSNPTESSLSSVLTNSATNHINLSADLTLTASRDIGTLRMDSGASARAVNLGANTLSIQSGGLLQTGGNGVSINGTGNLTVNGDGTSPGELFLHILGATTSVGAKISDNGTGAVTVVKNGGSALTLTNASNDFTGGFYINQGTVNVTSTTTNLQGALGQSGRNIILQGGTLNLRHDNNSVAGGVISSGQNVRVTANSTLQFDKQTVATAALINNTLAFGSLDMDSSFLTLRNNLDNTSSNTAGNYSINFTGGSISGYSVIDWARAQTGAGASSSGPGTATAPISRLTLGGVMSGDATSKLVLNNPLTANTNTVVFGTGASDTAPNTWLTELTINSGNIYLNKADGTANLNSNITVNGGSMIAGSESALAGVGANQIADTANITLNAGTVDFLGRDETFASLTMNGGFFRTDSDGAAGRTGNAVTITGDAVINGSSNNSGLNADNASVLNVQGSLKVGPYGRATASSSGTLNAGTVQLEGAGIRISSGAGASNFGLNGSVTTLPHGQASYFDGVDDSDSFLNLNSAGGGRVFNVADGGATDDLIVSVRVRDGAAAANGSGSAPIAANQSGITKEGAGKMVLRGTLSNQFTGTVTVNQGTLELAKVAGQNSISGNALVTAQGTLVQQRTSNQINDTANITMNGAWDLDFGNASETVGAISGTNNAANIRLGPGSNVTTNFSAATGVQTYAGSFTGSGLSSAATATVPFSASTPLPTAGAIVKQGAGAWNLTGNSELSGTLLVAAGEVGINGSMRGNTIFVQGTSTLSGAGDLASNAGVLSNLTVQSGATISPGTVGSAGSTIGMLTILDDLRSMNGSNINLNLNGSTLNSPALMAALATDSSTYDAFVASMSATFESTLGNGISSASHDRLSITGNFQHDSGGKINVSFLAGYTPVAGDIFDLFDWSTLNGGGFGAPLLDTTGATSFGTGLFSQGGAGALGDLELPALTGGLAYDVQLMNTHGIIMVVPEPSRTLLLLAGLTIALSRRRRAV